MKVMLNRAEMAAVLASAEKIAPSGSPIDVLKGVLVETADGRLAVTASNLEITLRQTLPADIQEEGDFVFPARLFAAMFRLMGGDTASLSLSGNKQLTLASGQAVYTMTAMDAKDYPRTELPFPEDTVRVTGIPTLARRTAFAVREDAAKPIMRCIHLIFSSDGLRAVGSDGFRIAAARGDPKSTGEISMLIPAVALEKLAMLVENKDCLMVGTTGNNIVFFKDGFTFSARLMGGEYIDANRMLAAARANFTVLTDAETLRRAVNTVSPLDGEDQRIMLGFQGNRIVLQSAGVLGQSAAYVDVIPLSGSPSGTYWYNCCQLYECLRAQSGTLMADVAQNGLLLLRTDDLICMQTASRPPQAARTQETPARAA